MNALVPILAVLAAAPLTPEEIAQAQTLTPRPTTDDLDAFAPIRPIRPISPIDRQETLDDL